MESRESSPGVIFRHTGHNLHHSPRKALLVSNIEAQNDLISPKQQIFAAHDTSYSSSNFAQNANHAMQGTEVLVTNVAEAVLG